MSRCVEKPFAPLVGSVVVPGCFAPCRTARLRHGASGFSVTGGRKFCRSKPNVARP